MESDLSGEEIRQKLQRQVIESAIELQQIMAVSAFIFEMRPGVFIVGGTKEDIKKLLEE